MAFSFYRRPLLKEDPRKSAWTLPMASGINNDGWIVGSGHVQISRSSRELHAYLLIPNTSGGSLIAAAAPTGQATESLVSPQQVQPLLAEALNRWQAAGVDTAGLGQIDIHIANLGGTTLGLASGHIIWLDANAAGWGWFVDPTPWDDSEFYTPGNQGEQHRIDLR